MTQTPNSRSIRVASINTYGLPFTKPPAPIRCAELARKLNYLDLDVLLLQEVFSYSLLSIFKSRLVNLPHVAYKASLIGPAGGQVVFSKRSLSNTSFIPFSRSPLAVKYKGKAKLIHALAPKSGVLTAELKELDLKIFNIHLSSNKDGDWSKTNRFYPTHESELEQLGAILIKHDYLKGSVIGGDFNIKYGSKLIRDFVSTLKLSDCFGEDERPTFHEEYLPKGRPPSRIDYLLTTSQLVKHSSDLILTSKMPLANTKGYLSDHLGLFSELTLDQ